jgi:microcystin-dependent protein
MSDPFIAEIKMFGGNFAPRGYAFCNGQILPIAQNTALFSLLGTTYGGDGRVTFALPNLQGRSPLGFGQGPGLSPYSLGEQAGEDSHTLIASEMPAHSHELRAADTASTGTPGASVALAATATARLYRSPTNLVATAAPLAASGGGQPHPNRQPYLAVSFIIALQGVFPARS